MQVPGQVQRGSGEGSEGSGEGLGGFGAEPGQVQQGSGEGSGQGLGGFGAEPGKVQQGSGLPEKVPGGFGAARSSSTGFRGRFLEKVWEALAQSQVRLHRLQEKVLEKVPGSLGAKPSQI